MKTWTDADLAILRRDYSRVPVRDLAEALGCTEMALRTAARRHDLQRRRQWWTPEEDARLLRACGTAPVKQLAREFGRTARALRRRVHQLRGAAPSQKRRQRQSRCCVCLTQHAVQGRECPVCQLVLRRITQAHKRDRDHIQIDGPAREAKLPVLAARARAGLPLFEERS